MDERLKFIARLQDGEKMAAVWRDFNVSRKTGYKILKRYNDVLTDGSRRQLPVQIETLILRCDITMKIADTRTILLMQPHVEPLPIGGASGQCSDAAGQRMEQFLSWIVRIRWRDS